MCGCEGRVVLYNSRVLSYKQMAPYTRGPVSYSLLSISWKPDMLCLYECGFVGHRAVIVHLRVTSLQNTLL